MRAAIALACVASVTWGATASARPTEVVATAGILSPTPSLYRQSAETLGYDRRGFRHVYEAEVALVQSLSWWATVGPVARFYYGDLSPPYDGVPRIPTYAGSLGARFELDVFPYPRLFLWTDPSIGAGAVGERTLVLWGIRGGVGIGSVRNAASVRFRFGYAHAPTFENVTADGGPFNFGGFFFQLDGAFRVAR